MLVTQSGICRSRACDGGRQLSIAILYFASLREALGVAQEHVQLPPHVDTVASVRACLLVRGSQWAPLSAPRLRVAVNQVLAVDATPVADGDEVAFFPPVTGG